MKGTMFDSDSGDSFLTVEDVDSLEDVDSFLTVEDVVAFDFPGFLPLDELDMMLML